MATGDNWYSIKISDDYHYPRDFTSPAPKRMGYVQDITTLPNFELSDPHFLLSDVQLSKGNPCGIRKVLMDVDGEEEILNY